MRHPDLKPPYKRGDRVDVVEPGKKYWQATVTACKPVRRNMNDPTKGVAWYVEVRDLEGWSWSVPSERIVRRAS